MPQAFQLLRDSQKPHLGALPTLMRGRETRQAKGRGRVMGGAVGGAPL